VILLAALVLLLSQEVEVRRLVEQLSSDRIEARAEAFRKLEGIGRPALPLLEKAAKDPDDEVATRAKSLLVRIPIRERLTPALISGVANICDRPATGAATPASPRTTSRSWPRWPSTRRPPRRTGSPSARPSAA
jgi:hypothetical protein